MKIIDTSKLNPRLLSAWERSQVYNGLDCCVTAEVLDVLLPQLDDQTRRTYDFSRQLQAPVLDMRMRGIKIDIPRRDAVLKEYEADLDRIETNLVRIARDGAGYHGFDWRSYQSLQRLFYDILLIPAVRGKEGRPTVNRAALEKMEAYSVAVPFIKHMTELRDLGKRISVLETEIDADGRIRTAYNIAGTTTGRFSSSFSEFGTGGNLQNIEESLRSVFVADDGMKLANFDAEQGESRVVGAIEWNLFRRPEYLDACESDDLHTTVAKLCWPHLGWTNSSEADKEIAERPFYRDRYSYRYMSKRLGHGTNYGGRPNTMSTETKIDITIILDFQAKYFKAFKGHRAWHEWVEQQIASKGYLVSLMGRKRYFFGRRDDDKVLRDAVAYDPQGSLSDIVNHGMLRVWRANDCQLLLQNHDSILVQYPEEMEDEIVPKIQAQLHNEIKLNHGRTLTIPYGCQTGWNWGKFNDDPKKGTINLDGLKDYRPGDQRTREA